MTQPDTARGAVLAFSTSGPYCSAAVLTGAGSLLHRHEDMARGQVERLIPFLEDLLSEAGLRWQDLAGLGVGIGPGNFTGIRIAVSAARGLALGAGIPAHGISTFEALAYGHPRPLLALVEAPRGACYVQKFTPDGAEPPVLAPPDEAAALPPLPIVGAADRAGREALAPLMSESEAMARITRARIEAGPPSERPAPLYILEAGAAPPSDPPPTIIP